MYFIISRMLTRGFCGVVTSGAPSAVRLMPELEAPPLVVAAAAAAATAIGMGGAVEVCAVASCCAASGSASWVSDGKMLVDIGSAAIVVGASD